MMGSGFGWLVLVVGASGVGKDTVIAGARDALADDRAFAFPRRIVTRASDATEDVETVDQNAFAARAAAGDFALSWSAYDLEYAIPSTIEPALRSGCVVVCNVSRSVVAAAAQR
ncbi:MAG: phosphonate metabolism protein/1,5-bisphosphokinase (PRPP-forming) PhnN, partial [Pseudomonadota bacterium]